VRPIPEAPADERRRPDGRSFSDNTEVDPLTDDVTRSLD